MKVKKKQRHTTNEKPDMYLDTVGKSNRITYIEIYLFCGRDFKKPVADSSDSNKDRFPF